MSIHLRAAELRPSTLNIENRTVEAIVSTGAEVTRAGFTERLDLSGADISSLINGPVLDGHERKTTRDQLGVVVAAEKRPEGIWVRMKFRQNPAAMAVFSDVADGTLRGLSIGYSIEKFVDTQEGKRRVRTVKNFTVSEVSIVPMPADPGAYFRNQDEIMQTTTDTTPVQNRAQANSEIRTIANLAGLERSWADVQIDADATVDAARQAAFAEMARTQGETRTRTTAVITVDHTDPAVIARRAGEALYARSHPEHQLAPEARAWAGLTMPELARDCLRRSGVATQGMSADSLITRSLHATSDFPLLLAEAVGRELRTAYEAAPSGSRAVARQSTARDFRLKRKISLGSAPALELTPESGEFKYGTIAEAQETYRLGTFGKIIGLSRQLIVNDDLGGLTDVPRAFGVQASALENQTLANLIIANPIMSDGIAVFNAATHGNQKASAGVTLQLIKDDLSAARLSMRKQKDLGGMLIDATPKFVLVPAELETVMSQALAEVQAVATSEVNTFSNLTLLVEPRLISATQFYVVAAPSMIDGLEFAYLEGSPGPQIESRVGFEIDGLEIKVKLDFGCGWVDYRSWFRVG